MKFTASAYRVPSVRNLWVYLHMFNGQTTLKGKPVEFEEMAKGDEFLEDREPTFELDTTAAQQLMDSLWTCGVRPTEGSGSAGSLAATQRHLTDMRAIVFDKLKVPCPEKK